MKMKNTPNINETSLEIPDARARHQAFGRLQRAFTGKIGRLPEAVRLELNRRLQNSAPMREIVDWLNALPEVQAVLASQFGGSPISEDNVSKWRKTGYPAWLTATATLDTFRNLALSAAGMGDAFQDDINGKLSILMTARFAAELQRSDCMEDGPDKTEAWRSLVLTFLALRRADYYGVKVREDRERAAIELERLRKRNEGEAPLSKEQKEEQMDRILGTGRFECNWDNQNKIWYGPGAALRYEEEEVERQVRLEMKRRYPNGFPPGYRPPHGGLPDPECDPDPTWAEALQQQGPAPSDLTTKPEKAAPYQVAANSPVAHPRS